MPLGEVVRLSTSPLRTVLRTSFLTTMSSRLLLGRALCVAALLATPALAQQVHGPDRGSVDVTELEDGTIVAADITGTYTFLSWGEYFSSAFFRDNRMRCGQDMLRPVGGEILAGTKSDCTNSSTNPKNEYDPSVARYCIPVVVHVIESTGGQGQLSDSKIQSQIDILNEDFLAIPGTNGGPGTNVEVEFALATVDPQGNPTTGITRTVNNTWYNDNGNFQSALNWDTCRYLNIYTNTASGYLGYAYIPNGGGVVCQDFDGVVCNWTAFGRNSSGGPPYNQGRTATHEVGHYLGLFHTFDGGCGSASACYTTGDLICDTEREANPRFGCPGNATSCSGTPDPIRNYMDYTDDLCMWEFTPEQARRMRCTIENWRPALFANCDGGGQGTLLFNENFESGNLAGWTISNGVRVKAAGGAANSGAFGARLKKGGQGTPACAIGTASKQSWMVSPSVDTTGYTSVELRFWAKTNAYETPCEELEVQWWTGSTWSTVTTLDANSWSSYVVTLPSGAANNPNLQLRFITNAKGKFERTDVDDVQVYGF